MLRTVFRAPACAACCSSRALLTRRPYAPRRAPQLTAGEAATWAKLPDMPYKRILGDMIYLCDGTLLVTGGGETGVAVRGGVGGGMGACPRARAAAL